MEVAIRVGGLPVHTGGQFAFILFHMDVEERNGSFGLLLHRELDFRTLTIQMLKETSQLRAKPMMNLDSGLILDPSQTPFFTQEVTVI